MIETFGLGLTMSKSASSLAYKKSWMSSNSKDGQLRAVDCGIVSGGLPTHTWSKSVVRLFRRVLAGSRCMLWPIMLANVSSLPFSILLIESSNETFERLNLICLYLRRKVRASLYLGCCKKLTGDRLHSKAADADVPIIQCLQQYITTIW